MATITQLRKYTRQQLKSAVVILRKKTKYSVHLNASNKSLIAYILIGQEISKRLDHKKHLRKRRSFKSIGDYNDDIQVNTTASNIHGHGRRYIEFKGRGKKRVLNIKYLILALQSPKNDAKMNDYKLYTRNVRIKCTQAWEKINLATFKKVMFKDYILPEFDVVKKWSTQVSRFEYKKFKSVKMTNYKSLQYKFLKTLGIVETAQNDGYCVIDYMCTEMNNWKHKAYSKMTRQKLITYFREIDVRCEDGVSTEDIIKLLRHKKWNNISLYALSPLYEVFEKYTAPRKRQYSLVYVLDNGHCYGIIDKCVKKSVKELNMLRTKKIEIELDYSKHKYFANITPQDINDIVDGKYDESVILIEDKKGVHFDWLTKIAQRIIQKHNTGIMPSNMYIKNSRIHSFKNPITGQIITRTVDYVQKRCTLNKLGANNNTIPKYSIRCIFTSCYDTTLIIIKSPAK